MRSELRILDGVRGLMALWVVAGHSLYAVGARLPVIGAPAMAVDVFIVMSGFLMMYHYKERRSREPWESPLTWRSFYIRRFFRIAPLYYLALTFALLMRERYEAWVQVLRSLFPMPGLGAPGGAIFSEVDLPNIFSHFSFLFGFFPRYGFSNPLPDWSIGLEMQFYLAFPFIACFMVKVGRVWSVVAGLLLFKAARYSFGLYLVEGPLGRFQQPSFLPLMINHFFIGMIIADMYFEKREGLKNIRSGLAALALALVFSGLSRLVEGIVLFVAAVLLYDFERDPLRIGFLLKPILMLLGSKLAKFSADMSYSTYLLHNLVLYPLVFWISGSSHFMAETPLHRWLFVFPAVVLICYALSYILFVAVERPGIALGRRIVGSFSFNGFGALDEKLKAKA